MADTGAPWNLPYPLPTDLVRDGADAIKDLADAVAAGLSAAGNPGIGSNFVQTVKSNLFTTTSTSFTDVTNLEVTITPSTATAKVLVLVSLAVSTSQDNQVVAARLMRGSTAIALGDADGTRTRATTAFQGGNSLGELGAGTNSIVFLDSPNVATATTYKVEVRTSSGTLRVNTSFTDADSTVTTRVVSTISAIEVAV